MGELGSDQNNTGGKTRSSPSKMGKLHGCALMKGVSKLEVSELKALDYRAHCNWYYRNFSVMHLHRDRVLAKAKDC